MVEGAAEEPSLFAGRWDVRERSAGGLRLHALADRHEARRQRLPHRILLDEGGKVRYHFVLIDYLCRPIGGELRAGSDAADVVIARPEDLPQYRLAAKATDIILKAFSMDGTW